MSVEAFSSGRSAVRRTLGFSAAKAAKVANPQRAKVLRAWRRRMDFM
jgi:hypothetical protein